jgi:hypothetical protein
MEQTGKQQNRRLRIQKIWDIEIYAIDAILKILKTLPEHKMRRKVVRHLDKWTKWDMEYDRIHQKT